MLNLTCTIGGGTLSPTNTCICSPAYYGEQCQFVISWWFPLNTFNHIFEGVTLIGELIWAIIVLISKIKQSRAVSLVGVSLILQIVAIISRLIFLVMPGFELVPFSKNSTMSLIAEITIPISIVLWLDSTTLIMAFWYENWTAKTKADGTIARKTKIILITISILFFICTLIGLTYLDYVSSYGPFIYIVPLYLIVITLIGLTIRISCFNTKNLSQKLKNKHRWTSRLFIVLMINWVIYCIDLSINSNTGVSSIISLMVFRLTESIASMINMALLDYKCRTLINTICCRKIKSISTSGTTKTCSDSNQTTETTIETSEV